MSQILIDGYNLIRQVPELFCFEARSLEAAREQLLAALRRYRQYKPHAITVVFDGRSEFSERAEPFRDKGLTICFSTSAQTADDVIVRLLQHKRGETVVVSSDRAVQQAARTAGAAVLDSVTFYKKVALALAMDGTLPADDTGKTAPAHKRWATFKKGPSKRLPKKLRQNKNRTKSL